MDINGFLTGTPSSTYTTDRAFTFGVCVQDRVATRVCTTATARVMPPEDEPLATCTGSATITLTGRLRDPGQPICQGAFPLTTSSSIDILMLGVTPGTRQAQVEMDRGVWICQNDQPRGLGQFFAPIITISPNGTAVGTSSDNAGRFDISFTLSGRTASGTVSRTFVQSDANWTFTGNFSCTF